MQKHRKSAVFQRFWVGILEKGFFHDMEEMDYFSLEQFNRGLWKHLEELNSAPFSKKPHSRRYYWEEERTELMPLPPVPYEYMERRTAKVSSDYSWGKDCKQCSYEKCYKRCPDFNDDPCPKLSRPLYVCNGCTERQSCKRERHLYEAKYAQEEYESVRSECRHGYAITPDEAVRIDSIVSPLIKRGQSLHQICSNNADEIMLAERTLYNYVDAGLFTAGNLDLPRKVRYKVRKKKPSVRVDRNCHLGRTYEDFLEYTQLKPDLPIVEIDSVEGRKGGKVLLTVFFRNSNLMLAYLRNRNTSRSVTEVFEWLYSVLGHELYCRMFPVILTDRGSEFTNPVAIECTEYGEIRSRVFYCNPQRSDQKGGCEVTHEFIRRILPKGTSFDHLQQCDVNIMMSHINSYTRKKAGQPVRTPVVQLLLRGICTAITWHI